MDLGVSVLSITTSITVNKLALNKHEGIIKMHTSATKFTYDKKACRMRKRNYINRRNEGHTEKHEIAATCVICCLYYYHPNTKTTAFPDSCTFTGAHHVTFVFLLSAMSIFCSFIYLSIHSGVFYPFAADFYGE